MRAYKTKHYLFHILKVVVVITAFVVIYYKFRANDALSWKSFSVYMKDSDILRFPVVLIILALSVCNWVFEILKWKLLSRQLVKISFSESVKQVLFAQTISIFTPYKTGEYGAKTLFFERKQVKKVIFLNFLGNFSQMMITLFFGVFGMYFFIKTKLSGYENHYFSVVLMGIIFFLIGNLCYKNIRFTIGKYSFQKLRLFQKRIPQDIKYKVLFYSFIRYLAFSGQFFLLLNMLMPVPFWETMLLIFSFYLLSSLLPMITFFDVVVKGSVALLVFSFVDTGVVLFITSVMWILNTVFPALLGSFYVIKLKAPSTKIQIPI